MSSLSKVALLSCLVLLLVGCSSEDEESNPLDDPASRESLRKAEPLAHGCKFVEASRSNVYESNFEDEEPRCESGSCDDVRSPSSGYSMYDGYGSVLSTSTTYERFEDFLGTCDDPQPISCKGREPADACEKCVMKTACAAPVICENDPNCTALADCFEYCKDDESCGQRCIENAQSGAYANLRSLANAVNRCGACH